MLLPFRNKSRHQTGDRLPRVMHALDLLITDERALDRRRDMELDEEYDYIHSAAKWARTIAGRRRINPDLAAVACVMMNIGRITTGIHDSHAETGHEPTQKLLSELGCFQPTEIDQIAVAVRNHNRKETTQAPLDEVVKDVDVYVRYLQGYQFTNPIDIVRLNRVKQELQSSKR